MTRIPPHNRSTLISSKLSAFLLIGGICQALSAAPQLSIKHAEFQFGYAPQSSKLTHTYWLYSTGSDTLKVINVTPGCGCTKAPLEKEILPPGDSTRLEITFDTRMDIGEVGKGPRIETNSGRTDTVRFYANVVERPDSLYPLTLKPYRADLSPIGKLVRDTVQITLTNASESDLNLTMIDFPADFVDIQLPASLKAHASAKGTVRMKKSALDSAFEKSFTFEVNDKAKSRFTVPVKRTLPDGAPDWVSGKRTGQ